MQVHDIPAVNAAFNATATVLIASGFVFIRRRQVHAHRACMLTAVAVSSLFLVGYVTHKILVHGMHTPFGGAGALRVFYYTMLFTHVVLAMLIVPLVLVTLRFAWRGEFVRHRAWARWTFPAWFYVSVTGVLVYFFLYQWFPASQVVTP